MKAIVFERPGRSASSSSRRPFPGPGEVRVAMSIAGVCGTILFYGVVPPEDRIPVSPYEILVRAADLGIAPAASALEPERLKELL